MGGKLGHDDPTTSNRNCQGRARLRNALQCFRSRPSAVASSLYAYLLVYWLPAKVGQRSIWYDSPVGHGLLILRKGSTMWKYSTQPPSSPSMTSTGITNGPSASDPYQIRLTFVGQRMKYGHYMDCTTRLSLPLEHAKLSKPYFNYSTNRSASQFPKRNL